MATAKRDLVLKVAEETGGTQAAVAKIRGCSIWADMANKTWRGTLCIESKLSMEKT
jgi:hypothetical protein